MLGTEYLKRLYEPASSGRKSRRLSSLHMCRKIIGTFVNTERGIGSIGLFLYSMIMSYLSKRHILSELFLISSYILLQKTMNIVSRGSKIFKPTNKLYGQSNIVYCIMKVFARKRCESCMNNCSKCCFLATLGRS